MTGSEVKNKLAELGIRPSRKLGQNFLTDPNMCDALVADAAPRAGEDVLEIGPGLGAMTDRLLEAGCRVTAVELDYRLAEYLRERFGGCGNFTLIEADACNLDYDELFTANPYRCIANLPYSAGSVILARLISGARPPRQLSILLQLEMAQRLAAEPRTKDYGALTVQVRERYEVQITRRVPPAVFYPPPEVGSASLKLAQRPAAGMLSPDEYAFFVRVVRTGFAQRRKRLSKLLGQEFGNDCIDKLFEDLKCDRNTRAEELTVEEFRRLSTVLRARL